MRLLRWSSKTCAACLAMEKSKTLERFVERHPDVKLVTLYCVDEKGEIPEGSVYEKNDELSDEYGVNSFPTLIFETDDGGELNSWEGGIPAHQLAGLYKGALARAEAAKKVASGGGGVL